MRKFEELTYRGQVRWLRQLARQAILLYPIKITRLDFIQHGENITFKVTDLQGKKYLLKIHRLNYHNKNQIKNELLWLRDLSAKAALKVPQPVKSKSGDYLAQIKNQQFPEGRFCSLYHWIEGRFIGKKVNENQLFQIGQMMASLHLSVKGRKSIRNYWSLQGLVGPNSHFGSLSKIKDVSRDKVRKLESARKKIFNKIKAYQKKYPESFGMIHADFHFGNLLWQPSEKQFALIDFDDCGLGFFLYDLAIPVVAIKSQLKIINKKELERLKSFLFQGYRSLRPLSDQELAYLDYFIMARRLLMVVWLSSRNDHPRLKKYLKDFVKKALEDVRRL